MPVNRFPSSMLGLLAGMLFTAHPAAGEVITIRVPSAMDTVAKAPVEVLTESNTEITIEGKAPVRESIFGDKSVDLANSHFTWGAEVGASIDLTGNDMSTFDIDAFFGYKNNILKVAGVGAGIHRTVGSGNNFIPVYALLRSSFTTHPSLCFLNARLGYSFNTVDESPMFGDFSSTLGCGFNLSRSRRVSSYLILSGGYRYFNERHMNMISKIDRHYIWIAQLQFGMNF